jgi:hypothetical protein
MPKFKTKEDYEIETFTKEYYKRLAVTNAKRATAFYEELATMSTWRGFLKYRWRRFTERNYGR